MTGEQRPNPFKRLKEVENRLLLVEEIIAGRIQLFQKIDQTFEEIHQELAAFRARLDQELGPPGKVATIEEVKPCTT